MYHNTPHTSCTPQLLWYSHSVSLLITHSTINCQCVTLRRLSFSIDKSIHSRGTSLTRQQNKPCHGCMRVAMSTTCYYMSPSIGRQRSIDWIRWSIDASNDNRNLMLLVLFVFYGQNRIYRTKGDSTSHLPSTSSRDSNPWFREGTSTIVGHGKQKQAKSSSHYSNPITSHVLAQSTHMFDNNKILVLFYIL